MTLFTEMAETITQAVGNEIRHPEMKGRRYQSRSIATLRQTASQSSVHEIGHALCWRRLLVVALHPTQPFQISLVSHHLQRSIIQIVDVFRPQLHHHATIAPCRVAMTRTHAIHHNLFRACSRWYHNTTRTHAEAVNAPAPHLGNETIFSCRQVLPPTLATMILYLVDAMRRMLQSHPHGNALRLNFYAIGIEPRIHITGRMTCSQDDRTPKLLTRLRENAHHLILSNDNGIHACLEMHLTSTA